MLKLTPKQLRIHCSLLFSSSRRYLSDESNKQESTVIKRLREEMTHDKQALRWRKTNEESGDIETKLKVFANNEQTSDYILMMQKPIKWSPKEWFEAWDKKKEIKERHMQQFMPERHQMLGPNLATAHFLLYRGGSVKFVDDPKWLKADENNEFNLPSVFDARFKLEAIKCDNMQLYYEGLANIRWLQNLKFLSFHNVVTFDDWCLDRISGSQCDNIEILDISGTKCTSKGLSCLYRLSNLKLLIVTDPKESIEYELTSAMLVEVLPELKIVSAASVHDV